MTSKNTLITAGSILIVLAVIFYWFEWRPSEIKKHCFYVSAELKGNLPFMADFSSSDNYSLESDEAQTNYTSCLKANGL